MKQNRLASSYPVLKQFALGTTGFICVVCQLRTSDDDEDRRCRNQEVLRLMSVASQLYECVPNGIIESLKDKFGEKLASDGAGSYGESSNVVLPLRPVLSFRHCLQRTEATGDWQVAEANLSKLRIKGDTIMLIVAKEKSSTSTTPEEMVA